MLNRTDGLRDLKVGILIFIIWGGDMNEVMILLPFHDKICRGW
jgi:hypothetical protein